MITRDVLLTGNTNADVEFITNAIVNNKHSEVQLINQYAKLEYVNIQKAKYYFCINWPSATQRACNQR